MPIVVATNRAQLLDCWNHGLLTVRVCGEMCVRDIRHDTSNDNMCEVWLRSNRRALGFGCVPLAALAASGAWLVHGANGPLSDWLFWPGAFLTMIGAGATLAMFRQMWQPRIAFRDGHVLFYLRAGKPFEVPSAIVEAFFVGQSPVVLTSGRPMRHRSLNLVARLSQRETDWAQREVKAALGEWRDGYVTVHGTWCEPITEGLVRGLNHRLKEVQTRK